jgi:hypothetical protein
MLYSRGGHKNINCGICHEVPAGHAANPSEKTRPKTEFSHESCGKCHVNEFKSMYSNKYHAEWTKNRMKLYVMGGSASGLFSRMQADCHVTMSAA